MKTLIAIALILLALSACGRGEAPCVNWMDPNEAGFDPHCA